MAEEALGTSFKRLCAHYSRMRCWRILSGLRGARPNKIVCRIRRLRRIRPILRLRFPRHSRVVFIFGGGNPRRAKQRQTGEEVEKCHQPQHGTKCCARGGFHQRWQGVGHHDFNHFKTNSSQKCSANQGFFCADGGAATARRSRRKADSWRRWKSPGQSIATSVSATQCCSGAGR